VPTLAGAVALAGKLPAAAASGMLEASRRAFERAFEVSTAVGAAVLLATALVLVAMLRRTGDEESAAAADARAPSL